MIDQELVINAVVANIRRYFMGSLHWAQSRCFENDRDPVGAAIRNLDFQQSEREKVNEELTQINELLAQKGFPTMRLVEPGSYGPGSVGPWCGEMIALGTNSANFEIASYIADTRTHYEAYGNVELATSIITMLHKYLNDPIERDRIHKWNGVKEG